MSEKVLSQRSPACVCLDSAVVLGHGCTRSSRRSFQPNCVCDSEAVHGGLRSHGALGGGGVADSEAGSGAVAPSLRPHLGAAPCPSGTAAAPPGWRCPRAGGAGRSMVPSGRAAGSAPKVRESRGARGGQRRRRGRREGSPGVRALPVATGGGLSAGPASRAHRRLLVPLEVWGELAVPFAVRPSEQLRVSSCSPPILVHPLRAVGGSCSARGLPQSGWFSVNTFTIPCVLIASGAFTLCSEGSGVPGSAGRAAEAAGPPWGLAPIRALPLATGGQRSQRGPVWVGVVRRWDVLCWC